MLLYCLSHDDDHEIDGNDKMAVKCKWKSLRKQEWQTYLWVRWPLCCCYIFYGVLCFSFQIELVLVRQHIVKVFNCVHFDPDGWSPSFQKKFNQAFNEHIQLLMDRIFRKGLKPIKWTQSVRFWTDLWKNNTNERVQLQPLFNSDITWEPAVPSFMMRRNTVWITKFHSLLTHWKYINDTTQCSHYLICR